LDAGRLDGQEAGSAGQDTSSLGEAGEAGVGAERATQAGTNHPAGTAPADVPPGLTDREADVVAVADILGSLTTRPNGHDGGRNNKQAPEALSATGGPLLAPATLVPGWPRFERD
jgi:hypothetical protein